MNLDYLKMTRKWDKPNVYWPILLLTWIVLFLFYIWTGNILNFYIALGLTITTLAGIYSRNYFRKKKA